MKLYSLKEVRDVTPPLRRVFRGLDMSLKGGVEILEEAARCWNSLDRFRKDRDRAVRYTYGDQWGDLIEVEGETMTEAEWLKRQGLTPLKNNLIANLVKTVLGLSRAQAKEPMCVANAREDQSYGELMSTLLQVNCNINEIQELSAGVFKEYVIGGLAVMKESFGWRDGRLDAWTDSPNPNDIFFDAGVDDYRHWNIQLVGELHDMSFPELCGKFAKSEDDYRVLSEMYAYQQRLREVTLDREHLHSYKYADFYHCADPTKVRVVEVWRREDKPRYRCHDWNTGEWYKVEIADAPRLRRENEDRIAAGVAMGMRKEDVPLIEMEWFVDDFWMCYFITSTGQILRQTETPYEFGSHPYTIKMSPFVDGIICSFVTDVIDQQRFVNHLIMTNAFTIKSSAKGALMIPEDCISSEMSYEEVLKQWARPDGAFIVKADKNGNLPRQVSSNSTNVGLWELLRLQIGLMENVSGIQGAMQGKQGFSGQSAAMYNMQQQNATLSQLDLLESYSAFTKNWAKKKLKMIQQYYDAKRIADVAGSDAQFRGIDPDRMGEVELDLNVVESTSTPAVRMLANDWLMQMFQAGAVGVKELLEVGDFPFGDRLLELIKNNEAAMAAGGQPEPVPEDIRQQIAANTDDANVKRIEEAMRR